MIQPTFKEFSRLAKQGNLIPVYQELLMDLETPLSFFKRLERDRYSFLLESVEGSERWSERQRRQPRAKRIVSSRFVTRVILPHPRRSVKDSECSCAI